MKHRTHQSGNSEKDPYTLVSFWTKPENQFWNFGLVHYSQETKDYFNDSVQRWVKRERVITRIK